jgi:hypothetical protein
MTIAAATLANYSPLHPLSSPPSGSVGRLLSEEIGVIFPLGICRLRAPPMRCLTGFFLDASYASSRGSLCE